VKVAANFSSSSHKDSTTSPVRLLSVVWTHRPSKITTTSRPYWLQNKVQGPLVTVT